MLYDKGIMHVIIKEGLAISTQANSELLQAVLHKFCTVLF